MPTRKALYKRLDRQQATLNKASAAMETTRKQLAANCLHERVGPYHWEHDNGYGRQQYFTGQRCNICQFIDHWKNGRFVDPANCRD